jgi:surface protein
MNNMFGSMRNVENLDLSHFNTSNVTDMGGGLFTGCSALKTINLSNWDTSKVTIMDNMFSGDSNLKTIKVSDSFTTNAVTNSTAMFGGCTQLVGGNGTTYNSSYQDKTYARIDASGTPGYFTRAS